MTKPYSIADLRNKLEAALPGAVAGATEAALLIRPERLVEVCQYLKTTPGLEFNYLTDVTAVDYVDYFEVNYQLTSLHHRHTTLLKVRVFDRRNAEVPSVVSVWRGADFQEREIWDLMGIRFVGHPNLKRILLWEGFPGHPLRKDYFYENVPGKYATED